MDQNNNQEPNNSGEEKTFTQAELNAIVQKRLGEEKAKYEKYEELKEKAEKFDQITEAQKSELQKATERGDTLQKELDQLKTAEKLRSVRDEVSKDTGVPASLLTGETKEDCEAQAKAILDFAKPGKYPTVKDSGEARSTGSGSTRDQFADWFSNSNGGH